jgi:hypothetical protein
MASRWAAQRYASAILAEAARINATHVNGGSAPPGVRGNNSGAAPGGTAAAASVEQREMDALKAQLDAAVARIAARSVTVGEAWSYFISVFQVGIEVGAQRRLLIPRRACTDFWARLQHCACPLRAALMLTTPARRRPHKRIAGLADDVQRARDLQPGEHGRARCAATDRARRAVPAG